MITCKNDRLLELLWFVGYCIEFPTQLAVRIGGGAEWNRRVMYRAIREGYVKFYRRKHKRHVIRSLSLTQKGLDYVAQSDPEAVAMIYSRINCSERVYPSKVDIPEGVIAIEVDQAVAKKLFGQTIAIRCYDNTVEHTVGEVNGSYWFKVDIGSQEGESNYEEEP